MQKTQPKNFKPNLPVAKKNYQKNGKWITKPFVTSVLKCACGNKYISTRKEQNSCVKCIYLKK